MIRTKIIMIIVLLFVFGACNQGSTIKQLGGGYVYHEASSEYNDIVMTKNISYLSSNTINEYLKKNIYSNVIGCIYNEKYIIAVQVPNKKWHLKAMIFELEDIYSYIKSNQIADSLISHDEYYQNIFSNDTNYWIIDKQYDDIWGPLQKKEYHLLREELRIPNSLRFNNCIN